MNLENMILKLLFEHCKAFVVCRFEILSGVEIKKHNIEGRKITLRGKEFCCILSVNYHQDSSVSILSCTRWKFDLWEVEYKEHIHDFPGLSPEIFLNRKKYIFIFWI